jgi:hypothetical protein
MLQSKDHILKTTGFIEATALSDDEKYLAAATENHLYILDLKTEELIINKEIEEDFQEIENLHFDKTGRLFIDHRSHFVIWDGNSFFEPEFQYEHLRGFCFQDSKLTGELLLSHPVNNRLFLIDANLKNCKEIAYIHFANDLASVNARFMLTNKLLIWANEYYTLKKFTSPGNTLCIDGFTKWKKAPIIEVFENLLVTFSNGMLRLNKLLPSGELEELNKINISVKNRNYFWLDTKLTNICCLKDDKLIFKNLKNGKKISEHDSEITTHIHILSNRIIHIGFDKITLLS